MNLKEALKLADKIVFEKTGQHLDDLQEAVLRGTLQRETYKEIAKNFNCSESNVRKIGSQLWEILSEELGENINKSNLRSTMGRFTFSNASTFEKEALVIGNFEKEVLAISSFNICGDTPHPLNTLNPNPSNQQTTNPQQTPTLNHDLSEMPNLGTFHNRTSELQTLKTSILTQNAQLLTITGITGIGKTALITQLVQQIKNQFEYIIWRTLQPTPTLPQLQTNLIEIFTHTKTHLNPSSNTCKNIAVSSS